MASEFLSARHHDTKQPAIVFTGSLQCVGSLSDLWWTSATLPTGFSHSVMIHPFAVWGHTLIHTNTQQKINFRKRNAHYHCYTEDVSRHNTTQIQCRNTNTYAPKWQSITKNNVLCFTTQRLLMLIRVSTQSSLRLIRLATCQYHKRRALLGGLLPKQVTHP